MTRLACCLVVLMTASIATAQPRDYLVDVWDTERGLPSSLVASVAQTPEGYLWVATQNGLLRFDGLRFVAFDPDNTPQLPHARVEHVFVDAAGTLWINTYDGSITSWRDGVFRQEWTGAGPHRFEAFLAVSTADETVFVLDTGALIRRDRRVGRTLAGAPAAGHRPGAALRAGRRRRPVDQVRRRAAVAPRRAACWARRRRADGWARACSG